MSAAALSDPSIEMDEDVLMAGDDRKAKDDVAGPDPPDPRACARSTAATSRCARILEQLTPLLISVNKRHKIKHSGIRITGLDNSVIVLLSGGTGGAKLARGMLDVLGPDRLAVIANTGDDIAAFGLHVSPDPDLVTYWLAGVIDEERGYGIEGETFDAFERLVQLGGAGVVQARRPGPGDLPAAHRDAPRGTRLTEIAHALARGARRRRRRSCRCATSRSRPTCAPRASGATSRST